MCWPDHDPEANAAPGAAPRAAAAPAAAGAGWRGELRLDYRRRDERTVAQDAHHGPLRVLQPLYPEGPAVCHHVLLHPPGGLVGGDELRLEVRVGPGAHALLTTAGATRFYRSEGAPASQDTRLEWLSLETIAHPGCLGANRVSATLAPGAEMMGWDLLALGLPASAQPFDRGCFSQCLHLPGVWLEQGRIDAADHALLRGGPGWAGQGVAATLWFAAGTALPAARRDALLAAARDTLQAHPLAATAGATAPQPQVVVLRVLAPGVEGAMQLLAAVRAVWRALAWGLDAATPRVWRT